MVSINAKNYIAATLANSTEVAAAGGTGMSGQVLVGFEEFKAYTVALLSSIPTTDVDALKKERIILEGNIPSPIKPPDGCKFHTHCYMACHFPEKKLDENGNYLFTMPVKETKE